MVFEITTILFAMLCGSLYKKLMDERKKQQVNRACKRDFLAMYRSLLHDISTIKQRNDELNEAINNGIKQ